MNQSAKNFLRKLFLVVVLNAFSFGFSHSGTHPQQTKKWILQEASLVLEANFISLIDQQVTLRELKTNSIVHFPITDFSMEDQLMILKHHELSEKINRFHNQKVHLEPTKAKKFSKLKAGIGFVFLLLIIISITLYFGVSKVRKPALISLFCSLSVFVIIACAPEEDDIPAEIETNTPPPTTEPPATDDSTTDSTTDTSTDNTDSSDTSTNNETNGTLVDTIISHFEDYSGVSITSDEEYFYINSFSWPEHGMGVGITSWQEQVPIPQNYTGDNSWVIPLNPEMADEPLSTSDHLLKGALAVAVNGVPIFNVYNNRGENAYLIGELDNWGGHFGRGDDYHYHLIPTHLEETIGSNQPLAYALDGYPVYGYTEETLDDAFGRLDSEGNYRYHAKTTAPYYMPMVMGKITLDPNSIAPNDQIYPQPVQNPIRPSNDFKPVDGATVTGFSQTGTNAFSFEYTVSGTKYYVNYNWDDDCKFTYSYVDENGSTTNLPTYGAIADTSENIEVYSNVNFCQDVNLGDSNYAVSDNTSTSANESTETETSDSTSDTSVTGFSVSSENSNFTLSSVAVDTDGEMLDAYKCEKKTNGIENSIPIAWSNVPEGTGSLAISIHGFPNPTDTNSYLTLWNIDPSITEIPYGEANSGSWFMGPNKDGASISYSSPCNPSGGSTTYYMTIYALSETPSSLPDSDSLEVNYTTLIESLTEVTIIDQVVMEYVSTSN